MEKIMKPLDLNVKEETNKSHTALKIVRFCIIMALIFGCVYMVSKPVITSHKEILFSIQHPELVRELRSVYDYEHSQADERILSRQRAEFITAGEAGASATPKK